MIDFQKIGVYTHNMVEDKNKQLADMDMMLSQHCIDFNLRKATRAITQFYDSKIKNSGITVTQHTLLTIIKMIQPITITKLSETAVMDRTTLARNLKLLEKKSLVKINPGQDRRERLVSLTKLGKKTQTKSLPLWEDAQAELLSNFGNKNWKRVKNELSKLVELVKEN